MQFGKVDDPEVIDFTLPKDHPDTKRILSKNTGDAILNVYVGCAKWNKTDLKNFYPKGTKDELAYYATQFNSIELNATFYKSPSKDQVEKWKEKASVAFKFFPKIPNTISHFKRLVDVKPLITEFSDAVVLFEEKKSRYFYLLHHLVSSINHILYKLEKQNKKQTNKHKQNTQHEQH